MVSAINQSTNATPASQEIALLNLSSPQQSGVIPTASSFAKHHANVELNSIKASVSFGAFTRIVIIVNEVRLIRGTDPSHVLLTPEPPAFVEDFRLTACHGLARLPSPFKLTDLRQLIATDITMLREALLNELVPDVMKQQYDELLKHVEETYAVIGSGKFVDCSNKRKIAIVQTGAQDSIDLVYDWANRRKVLRLRSVAKEQIAKQAQASARTSQPAAIKPRLSGWRALFGPRK